MPCYLFTYHAYGSWMPDREQGFVQRGQGILPADEDLARQYRSNAKQSPVTFQENVQRVAVDELHTSFAHQTCRGHFVATDSTHIHVLVSWKDERPWKRLRSGLKSSLTRRFNREFRRRIWLSDSASRKHVKD